jgi:hypothetical protein
LTLAVVEAALEPVGERVQVVVEVVLEPVGRLLGAAPRLAKGSLLGRRRRGRGRT